MFQEKTIAQKRLLGSLTGRRGLSFPELMITCAILAVAALVVMRFLKQESEGWQVTMAQQGLVSELEQVASEVNRELRNATRAAVGTPPNITLQSATDLRFYLPGDVDGNGTILDAIGAIEWATGLQVQYLYDAPSRQLRRRTLQAGNPVGTTRVIGDDITVISFADQTTDNTLLADEIRMTLTALRTTTQGRAVTMSVNTIIRLRN